MKKGYLTPEGGVIYRISGWLSLHYELVSERSPLYEYADSDHFVRMFTFLRQKYALEAFTPYTEGSPKYLERGVRHELDGVLAEDRLRPLYIEHRSDGEAVRLWIME